MYVSFLKISSHEGQCSVLSLRDGTRIRAPRSRSVRATLLTQKEASEGGGDRPFQRPPEEAGRTLLNNLGKLSFSTNCKLVPTRKFEFPDGNQLRMNSSLYHKGHYQGILPLLAVITLAAIGDFKPQ